MRCSFIEHNSCFQKVLKSISRKVKIIILYRRCYCLFAHMNKSKETKGSEQAALHMKKISQLKYEQRETD